SAFEVLRLIRAAYPQRLDGQCEFRYDGCGSRCTRLHDHGHCARCREVCAHTLCEECEKASDHARFKLTKARLDYEHEFGVPFKEDEEYLADVFAPDDCSGRGWSDREDFHADG